MEEEENIRREEKDNRSEIEEYLRMAARKIARRKTKREDEDRERIKTRKEEGGSERREEGM